MISKTSLLNRFVWTLTIVWTLLMALSLQWNLKEVKSSVLGNARIQAMATFNQDILHRRWNASHGGVYVPITEETPPNPYLPTTIERDIKTPSGKLLTLMNPAYMTRQVHELGKREYEHIGHITSLRPIRPQNAPDLWEAKALQSFEKGETEVISLEMIEDSEYMRLMRPLVTEKTCLKCHADQGYKEGDIRGGISVSIPMKTYWAVALPHIRTLYLAHFLLWLTGLCGIGLSKKTLSRSEERLRRICDATFEGIFITEEEKVVDANIQFANMFGYQQSEIIGKSVKDLIAPEYHKLALQHIKENYLEAYELVAIKKDDSRMHIEVRGRQISYKGRLAHESVVRDITKSKKAEKELKQQQYYLEKAQELGRIGTWVLDIKKNRLIWTDENYRIFGIPPGTDLTYDIFLNCVHPDDRKYVDKKWTAALNKAPYDIEHRILVDGNIKWVREKAELEFNDKGNCVYGTGYTQDITERKLAEDWITSFGIILEESLNEIYIFDSNTLQFIQVNKGARENLGYSMEELGNLTPVDLKPEFTTDSFSKLVESLITGKKEQLKFTTVHRRKDNTLYPVEVNLQYSTYKSSPAFIAIILDITDRKKAEETLRDSNRKYSAIFDNANDAIYLVDPETQKILEINDTSCKMTGYSKEELKRMYIYELHPKDERALLPEKFNEVSVKGSVQGISGINQITKDGKLIPIEVNATIIELDGKKLNLSIIRDITERKQAEEEIQTINTQMHIAIDNMPNAYIQWDKDLRVTEWNKSAERIFGYSKEEMLGENPIEFIVPEETRHLVVDVLKRLKVGEVVDYSEKNNNIRKDGKYISCQWFNTPLADHNGNVFGILTLAQDITERKKAEEALHRYDHIVSSSTDMLALLDDRFTYLAANQAYVNAFDKNLEELIGHNVIDVFGEEFFNVSIKPHAVSCLAGNEISYQSWFEFPSYGKRFMDITYFPYRDSDNKVQGFVVRGRNMTEQKLAEEEKAKLEEQLLQSQKMEAIGQLTGGIAHDFNNILQTIVGYAHIIKKEVTEDSNVMSHITQVLKSSEKAQYLTQSLLAFSRKQIMNPKANNLNGLIQREGKLLRRLIGEDIDLKTELSDEDLIIYADFAQIEQVLMNFATNARDAMPRGGKLLIKTNQVELDNEFIQSHGYGKAGNYAHLIVSDTGVGMDEETRQNVFNPFFTTKEVDKGTGLGLSVTYGIIKQHSGYIDVESKEGEGTTFNIYLPITEKEIKAKKAVESQTISKGTETILVIEDNEDVRKLLSVVLEKSGYTVIEAVDGEDGFKKFNDNNEKLDLIISDLVMPKMDGEKVHEEVSKIRPEMKILFISGFTSDSDKVKNIIEKGYHYLLKPVMPDNLLKEVRGILDIDKG